MLPEPITDPASALGPTDVIDCAHREITAAAEAHGAAADPLERAASLFRFVRDEVRYDLVPELTSRASWRASNTLARGSGFCQQKAVLLCALARARGIPAAMGFQHIRDHKLIDPRFERFLPGGIIAFHGRAALWLEGRWCWVDPALDAGLCAAKGYRLVELRGSEDAPLPATDLAGRPHFDVLGDFGPFSDLPEALSTAALGLAALWTGLGHVAKKTGATM